MTRLPDWEDPRVQIVYKLMSDPDLCGWTNREEHWEGWLSRNIVAALDDYQKDPTGTGRRVA